MNELQKRVAEVAKHAGSANGKTAFSELITELVQPRHLSYELLRSFMPVVERKPGDYFARKIRKGRFRARTMVPGAQHLTDAMIYNAQFAYVTDRLIAGTSMNIMEVRNGELGTVDQIKDEVRKDLTDEIISKVFNLLTTVWNATNTPLNYVNATGTGLTATVLDAAIENLIEKAGNVNAIIGTRRAVYNLFNFAGYREVTPTGANTNGIMPLQEILMERFNTGTVSMYNGTPVIIMPQILDNRLPTINRKLVRDDTVLLLGDTPGEIVLFGDPEDQEHLDTTKQPADWIYHTWQQYGLLVDRPEYMTVIEVA
jgi:hypothetical protein